VLQQGENPANSDENQSANSPRWACLLLAPARASGRWPMILNRARKNYFRRLRAKNPSSWTVTLGEWAGVPVPCPIQSSAIPKGSGGRGDIRFCSRSTPGGTWSGPDDQTSARPRIVYDADNVYFGFVVTDDYHPKTSANKRVGTGISIQFDDRECGSLHTGGVVQLRRARRCRRGPSATSS